MLPFLTLLAIVGLQIAAADTTLQEPDGIILLFRHGAKAPMDSSWDASWGGLYGQLTNVGMRQKLLRGAYLSKLYPKFFAAYDAEKVYIRSTDVNRTIMSAYSLMLGAYDGKGPVFQEDYPLSIATPPYPTTFTDDSRDAIPHRYQPLPIHTAEFERDELLLSCSGHVCPASDIWMQDQLQASRLQTVLSQFEDTFALIALRVNYSGPLNIMQVLTIYDTVYSNHYEGIPTPGNISLDSELGKNLTFLFNYVSIFSYVGTARQKQICSINLLNQFQDDIQAMLQGSINTF